SFAPACLRCGWRRTRILQVAIGKRQSALERRTVKQSLNVSSIFDRVHFRREAGIFELGYHQLRADDWYQPILVAAEEVHWRVIGGDVIRGRCIAILVWPLCPRTAQPVR